MKSTPYYPRSIAAQIIWLTTFGNKIKELGAAIGLTPEQIAAIVADCMWLIYLLQEWVPTAHKFSSGATEAVNEAQFGDGTALTVLPTFTAPELPNIAFNRSPVAP
jgi:hypothetical protein